MIVPTRDTLIPLLKEAQTNKKPFAYLPNNTARACYIQLDSVSVILEILDWLDMPHREDFLDLVPGSMTTLAMRCWEIKTDPYRHRRMLRLRPPQEPEFLQYEFQL